MPVEPLRHFLPHFLAALLVMVQPHHLRFTALLALPFTHRLGLPPRIHLQSLPQYPHFDLRKESRLHNWAQVHVRRSRNTQAEKCTLFL